MFAAAGRGRGDWVGGRNVVLTIVWDIRKPSQRGERETQMPTK